VRVEEDEEEQEEDEDDEETESYDDGHAVEAVGWCRRL
jgi:hypothetical protein